jgi:cytochrome c biogenesis protein CcmG, thiol:disulfide interchange protein DsbE
MSAAEAGIRPAARPAGRLQTIVVLGVTAVVIAAAAYLAGGGLGKNGGVTDVTLTGSVAAAAPVVGALPPGFTATTFDGKTVSLADYAGKPLWLTFGASWCPDCRTESPDVQAAYQKYKAQGLNVLAVFINEPATDIAAYAGRVGLTFPIAVDEQTQIASRYRTMGIPTHFFIGADGRIKDMRIGALAPSDMDGEIAAILH